MTELLGKGNGFHLFMFIEKMICHKTKNSKTPEWGDMRTEN
jgi:hypothetical protein